MNNKTVLIVDDEPNNLEVLVDSLQELDFVVLMTNNAPKAFEIAKLRLPDVIITDWEMPEVSGIELVEMLKADEKTTDIPVIMCTGVMMSSENLKTALDAGAVDYIRKPIDRVELTARLNSTLRLSESLKQIKTLNANKDRLFEIIGHDLSGPVGNIYSILDPKLIEMLDGEKLKVFLSSARNAISSTYGLLQNLLYWARAQRNRVKYFPSEHSLNLLIDENINLLSGTARAKNIALIFKEEIEHVGFFDKNMILTVIRNLINNAIKFTPENGKIELKVIPANNEYVVSVADTGVGIAAENLEKIFKDEGFTSYGTNREKGSGLGLKICNDFVEMNKGKLTVETKVGKGSTFTFTIPKKKQND